MEVLLLQDDSGQSGHQVVHLLLQKLQVLLGLDLSLSP